MIAAGRGPLVEHQGDCRIVQSEIAVSVGCMLSRVRTGISNNEVTCAIPWPRLADLLGKLSVSVAADQAVAKYAAEDSKRFQ
jgi:uncharacterized protein (DUF169 family)